MEIPKKEKTEFSNRIVNLVRYAIQCGQNGETEQNELLLDKMEGLLNTIANLYDRLTETK